MFHIPAHKNVTNPPGQWINPECVKEDTHEVREPEKTYEVEPPDPPDED